MVDTYTPATVAKQINVSPNTVRRWCNQHSEHLSAGAVAPVRSLTDLDLTTLQYVATLRASGMQTDAINERLSETTLTPGEILLPEATQTAPVEQEQTEALQVPALLLQAHTATLERLTASLEQQARLEQQRIAEVKHLEVAQAVLVGEVATLRTWLLVLAAIVVVLLVAMVAMWAVA